jgi:hypothetical protein
MIPMLVTAAVVAGCLDEAGAGRGELRVARRILPVSRTNHARDDHLALIAPSGERLGAGSLLESDLSLGLVRVPSPVYTSNRRTVCSRPSTLVTSSVTSAAGWSMRVAARRARSTVTSGSPARPRDLRRGYRPGRGPVLPATAVPRRPRATTAARSAGSLTLEVEPQNAKNRFSNVC